MIKKRLMTLLPEAKKYIILQVLCQWAALLCQVIAIYGAVSLISGAIAGTLAVPFVVRMGVTIAAACALRYILDGEASHNSYMASAQVKPVLRGKIYDKLLRLGASYRESTATSTAMQMATEGVEQLETYFGKYMPQLFYSLLAPLTLFVILAPVNIRAAVVLLICVPLIPLAIVAVQKIAKRIIQKYLDIYAGLGDSFLENLQGMTTLKIYQADGEKADEMDKHSQYFRKVTMKVLTMQLNSTSVMDIVACGGAAVGMVVAIGQYIHGNVSLGGALFIILLAPEFFIPLRLLGSYFHIAMNGMQASDRIFELLDLPEPESGTEELGDGPVGIRLSNVSFSYEEGKEILKGIDLDIPAGSFTSLVGLSGCGKSTVAGILMGRNKHYGGSITIGGKELADVSEASLMQHVTLVTHESYLFKGTVRENLLMGKPDATDEELRAALQKVSLLDFLDTEDGLDTELEEHGSNFSGGQRQRLAIARALLHDTPVYIFDEATSNIDAASETLIMRAIHELAGRKTVLLISHRLANVVRSDQIYVLDAGNVAEYGTHTALMANGGVYKKLYEEQRALEVYAGDGNEGLTGAGRGSSGLRGVKRNTAAAFGAGADSERTAGYGDSSYNNVAAMEAAEEEPLQKKHDNSTGTRKRRSGIAIMGRLIGLVKPLIPVMLLAILLGVVGYLCAISLSILASGGIIHALLEQLMGTSFSGSGLTGSSYRTISTVLIVAAVARGFLHYGEQYCNHFIAFKLLAIIRHKVFAALRRLCPAKLEGKDQGNLISILTSDIELLEVFYAHTISPIAIAIIISVIMTIFIGSQYAPAAVIAVIAYAVVGILIPIWNGKRSADAGMQVRDGLGSLNGFVLDSLRGLDETIQYGTGAQRREELMERSGKISRYQKKLNGFEMTQHAVTNLAVEIFSFVMLFFMLHAFGTGAASFQQMLLAYVAMAGSFGPVIAISNLSVSLNQTLASGERVLRLLEESPEVEEVNGKEKTGFTSAAAENVTFSYDGSPVLTDFTLAIPGKTIVGIYGPSGCGKSTFLKLLMRFWDTDEGRILISGKDVREVNTSDLRNMEGYVTQETYLFHDTIFNNIALAKQGATREEVEAAAKKASLDAFIAALPNGYDTQVGELGDTLSGGEKQRIGLARAFLHDAPLMLLDEPTSNLDALNEGAILKSLAEERAEKTVVLVSHRKSTLHIADKIVEMRRGSAS